MQNNNELDEDLKEQIGFLVKSCKLFDAGDHTESKRLAVTARVLLYDSKTSHSLLGQLRLLNIVFYSTATPWNPNNLLPHFGLLQIQVSKQSSYRAPLDDRPPGIIRWISFEKWWSEVVFDDRKGNKLTRKDIILALANKEGGAHIDQNLPPTYETIAKKSSFWFVSTEQGKIPLEGKMTQIAMRQIAHEILRTLAKIVN